MLKIRNARFDMNGDVLCEYRVDSGVWIRAHVTPQSVEAERAAYERARDTHRQTLGARAVEMPQILARQHRDAYDAETQVLIEAESDEERRAAILSERGSAYEYVDDFDAAAFIEREMEAWKYDGVMACTRISEQIDTLDIAPFEPPADWKSTAQGRVRATRDELLRAITDPHETSDGRLAWNAKLLSALVVLVGAERLTPMLGLDDLPPEAQVALSSMTNSMSYLASQDGMTVEQFAFKIVGKFLGYSAFIWLADAKTHQAWAAIDALPEGAEGFAMLPALEQQLRAEAEATAAAAAQLSS